VGVSQVLQPILLRTHEEDAHQVLGQYNDEQVAGPDQPEKALHQHAPVPPSSVHQGQEFPRKYGGSGAFKSNAPD
jgi:hypothetical protein